jgi:hypothetical protein
VISPSPSGGWLWTTVIDYESGIQYMLVYYFHQFYQDTVKLGDKIKPQIVNEYKQGVVYQNRKAEMVLEEVYTDDLYGINLPQKYRITLPGGKVVVLKKCTTGSNRYPIPPAPVENIGFVYNENEDTIIGGGVLEANLWLNNKQISQNYAQSVSFVNSSPPLSLILKGFENKPNVGYKILAFLYVLLPLWIITVILVITFCKKEGRTSRFIVSCVVFILLYLALTFPYKYA